MLSLALARDYFKALKSGFLKICIHVVNRPKVSDKVSHPILLKFSQTYTFGQKICTKSLIFILK